MCGTDRTIYIEMTNTSFCEWRRITGPMNRREAMGLTGHIRSIAMILCFEGRGRAVMSWVSELRDTEVSSAGLYEWREGRLLSFIDGILHR